MGQALQFYYSNPKPWPNTSPTIFDGSSGLKDLSGPVKIELSAKEEEQIKEIFELFDTDGGGTMDSRELEAARFALGFDRGQMHKHEPVRPRTGANLVTLEEFSSMMKGEKLARGPFDGVWMVFSVLCSCDQGGDSSEMPSSNAGRLSGSSISRRFTESSTRPDCITFDGLRQACNQFNLRLSEDEVQEMMAEADPSCTGKVDIDSFFRMVGSAPWF